MIYRHKIVCKSLKVGREFSKSSKQGEGVGILYVMTIQSVALQ